MRWTAVALCSLGALAVAATWTTPAPAGACSFAHPCDEIQGSESLTGLTLTLVEGPDEAVAPELPDEVVLEYDGWGNPRTLTLGEEQVWLNAAEVQ